MGVLDPEFGKQQQLKQQQSQQGLFSQAIDAGVQGLDPRKDSFAQILNFIQNSQKADTQRKINAANAFSGISGATVKGVANPLLGANIQAFKSSQAVKEAKDKEAKVLDDIIKRLDNKIASNK